MPILYLQGVARDIEYTATMYPELRRYNLIDFDVNMAAPYGVVNVGTPENSLAFSTWLTPKRTRTYPFARTYNIFHMNTKRVAIIPIIKDEGGSSQNNDRINFITFSWMNLLNVYIILGWYENADRATGDAHIITNQQLNTLYIRNKLAELSHYHPSALHWNTSHFENDFQQIYLNAIESYERISRDLNVRVHSSTGHLRALSRWTDNNTFSLEAFKRSTMPRSLAAARRETSFTHVREYITNGAKGILEIRNNLGGEYYLTVDEVFINETHVTLQECKNSGESKLPSEDDIKDGLFKLILFSNIRRLAIDDIEVTFNVQLKLTGNRIRGVLSLPADNLSIASFCSENDFRENQQRLIQRLNYEVLANPKLSIKVGGRDDIS